MNRCLVTCLSLLFLIGCGFPVAVKQERFCARSYSQEKLRESPELLRAEQKRMVMKQIYDKGMAVRIILDPRPPQVIIPAAYKSTSTRSIILEYGSPAVMVKPIIDLQICSDGLSATLSFSGRNALTFIPWNSVFAIYDKDQTLGTEWQEDVPADLQQTTAN